MTKQLMVYMDQLAMRRAKKASKLTGKPMTQIAREAIEEKIDGYAREYPELAKKHFRRTPPKKKAA